MLSTNKISMDNTFAMLAKKGTANNPDAGGAIYKAAYHAYFDKTYDNLKSMQDPTDADLKADLASKKILKTDVEESLRKDAHEFASYFADAMDECLSEISNQIDQHIKSMCLNIIMQPQGIATIVSPTGPCSGSMIISDSTAQIMIS